MTLLYRWYGYDRHGRTRTGYARGTSSVVVRARLCRMGIVPIRCVTAVRSVFFVRGWWQMFGAVRKRSLSSGDAGRVCKDLGVLCTSGIPVSQALILVAASMPACSKRLCQIERGIARGMRLGDAFTVQGGWPPVIGAAITACQGTGSLAEILHLLGDAFLASERYQQELRRALVVPGVTLGAAGVLFFLVVQYGIPLLASVTGQPVGVDVRDAVWVLQCGGAGMLVAGCIVRYLVPATWRGRMVYQMPLLGVLYAQTHCIVGAHLLRVVVRAGVPLVAAFRCVSGAIPNYFYRQQYEQLAHAVSCGVPIASAVRQCDSVVMPEELRRCFSQATCQQTLVQLLAYAVEQLGQQYQQRVGIRLALIQPVLLIIIGGGVGTVLCVVLEKVFTMTATFGQI